MKTKMIMKEAITFLLPHVKKIASNFAALRLELSQLKAFIAECNKCKTQEELWDYFHQNKPKE